ncbi:MAG: HAD hydrolase-like protein [Pseudomonadota bacterium]|jgi:HAD superfamily hydrolase (TIGR01450 family)|nr:MAG: haloacid dehalogenase [Pseudomonadota bacterium]
MSLGRVRGFMFDLDGTLVLGDRTGRSYDVLPGAVEVLAQLRERSIPYVVLTNGSGQPPARQAARLRAAGLPVEDAQMLTPSSVTAEVLLARGVRRVLVLGSPGVGHVLEERGIGITFTGEPDCERVDAVYIGWHPECGMRDIEAACNAIWGGAKCYVASDVPFFASRAGRTIGYSYAIVGAVRRMTKVRPIVTGKPSLHALRHVARTLGVKTTEVGVVGDDPLVEMIMARRGGATGFGVCTGTTSRAQWRREPPSRRPHHLLDGVGDLLRHLSPRRGRRT